MSVTRICAVVVTFNRADLLVKVLEGLEEQSRPPDEVLLIDNASTDKTTEMLATRYPGVVLHRLERNMGASGGFSEGVRVAHERGFDWIWLLDDDVVAEPGCLSELLDVAELSGKKVVTPRRRDLDVTYPRNEAVIDEATQSYRFPEGEGRWLAIDIFTFEGPLFHRSVIDAVGIPNPRLFITADDTDYSVRIYRAFGPLACALATGTAVNRLLTSSDDVLVKSRLKRIVTGDAIIALKPDDQFWKYCYYLRNRHLIWKLLGWKKRRARQLLLHAGYVLTDAIESRKRGWDWRFRLRKNSKAFLLGLAGKDGMFIDPTEYNAERKRRAGRTPA